MSDQNKLAAQRVFSGNVLASRGQSVLRPSMDVGDIALRLRLRAIRAAYAGRTPGGVGFCC